MGIGLYSGRGAINMENVLYNSNLITDHDTYLFKEGNHFRLYDKLGSHLMEVDGVAGTHFAVWAPNAASVSVIGSFNEWNPKIHILKLRSDGSGIWEGFIPAVRKGDLYKYHIISKQNNYKVNKSDPFAFYCEVSPKTASIVWNPQYEWSDKKWMKERHKHNAPDKPMTVYEIHLGSWKRVKEENNRYLTYREMAAPLAEYVKEMGFTHVELMPIMEHPFDLSWGYQVTGYYAPTSRFGTPEDFMYLVDHLHRNGIGVILDWVPSHFPGDEHGLAYFDGTHLYEHADMRKGFHPDWKSYIFNYDRYEVKEFLISSALYWLDKYHADGLRVDAVASMLYLVYSRKEGEWIPNKYGGRENLEAIAFLRQLNEVLYGAHPDIEMIAEDSTAWPMVSRPASVGGLGFGMKWNMGWMHDTLLYFSRDPVYRKYEHNQITFSIWYAFSENFLLPFSHDEVVHGKGSLLNKMPGDDWQKFANLRLLFGYMYGHPGKKLLFMGDEFAQRRECNNYESLEWQLLQYTPHKGIQKWVRDLNDLYKREPALHKRDFEPQGFEWVDFHDWENSVISFTRKGHGQNDTVLVICNFTPIPRHNYKVNVPKVGIWQELLNSDAAEYGGSGIGNLGGIVAIPSAYQPNYYTMALTLPPLGVLFFKHKEEENKALMVRGG